MARSCCKSRNRATRPRRGPARRNTSARRSTSASVRGSRISLVSVRRRWSRRMSSWKAWRQSCGRSVAPISNLCGAYPRRADFRDRHLDRQDIVDEEDGAHVAPVLKPAELAGRPKGELADVEITCPLRRRGPRRLADRHPIGADRVQRPRHPAGAPLGNAGRGTLASTGSFPRSSARNAQVARVLPGRGLFPQWAPIASTAARALSPERTRGPSPVAINPLNPPALGSAGRGQNRCRSASG